MAPKKLPRLLEKRESLRRAVKARCEAADPTTAAEMHFEMTKLDNYAEELRKLDSQIFDMLDDDEDFAGENDACLALLEELARRQSYLAVLSQSVDQPPAAAQVYDVSAAHQISSGAGRLSDRVLLPKMKLVTFEGDPLEWQSFWDNFEATVHNCSTISDVEKFGYLKESLKGRAAAAIKGITLNNGTYAGAINVLKERFGLKELVTSAHAIRLVKMPVCSDSSKLRELLDYLENHVCCLRNQGVETSSYGVVVAPLLLERIPDDVRLKVTQTLNENVWKFDDLFIELKRQARTYEINSNAKITTVTAKHVVMPRAAVGSFVTNTRAPANCAFCSENHCSSACPLPVADRFNKASENRLCFSCLNWGHHARQCNRFSKCKCGGRHHVALCRGLRSTPNVNGVPSHVANVQEQVVVGSNTLTPSTVAAKVEDEGTQVNRTLMQTAMVSCQAGGKSVQVRVLFDPGSKRSFITEAAGLQLCLKSVAKETLAIAGFGVENPTAASYSVVRLMLDGSTGDPVTLVVVPRICTAFWQKGVSAQVREELKRFHLADPRILLNNTVVTDVLIGIDHYWRFVTGPIVKIGPSLKLVRSVFGYVVSGSEPGQESGQEEVGVAHSLIVNSDEAADGLLQQFWDLESIGIKAEPKPECVADEESTVVQRFKDGITHNGERYVVHLPWKEDRADQLPDNRGVAFRRFQTLIRRLQASPEQLRKYHAVITEQLQRGFIEPVGDEKVVHGKLHYISHHGVVKEDSQTTKLRVVYDASARADKHSFSMNDCLYTGPDLVGSLFDILVRFRLYETGMVADIEKAFLMVGLAQEDRDSTRFFWVRSLDELDTPVVYRFVRVLFGATSSPFLLMGTMEHHLEKAIMLLWFVMLMWRNYYMDNLVVSLEKHRNAQEFYSGAKDYMAKAGMVLRQWSTSDRQTYKVIPEEDKEKASNVKVLGLRWDTELDTLSLPLCKFDPSKEDRATKRAVSSIVSQAYDPLGFMSPVVVRGKFLLREVWASQVGWDDEIPKELILKLKAVKADFAQIHEHKIHRSMRLSEAQGLELHAFGDASAQAYAAVIYLKFWQQNQPYVEFVSSKARVSPTGASKLTMPRLELLGVLLAVRLLKSVKAAMGLPLAKGVVWTDSQVVLTWIKSERPLKKFVTNRVQEVRSVAADFRYVPGSQNPADVASRGCSLQQLRENQVWWRGPKIIVEQEEGAEPPDLPLSDDAEQEFAKLVAVVTAEPSVGLREVVDIKRFSKLDKLLRVVAMVLRFVNNLRTAAQSGTKPKVGKRVILEPEEIAKARVALDKATQAVGFPDVELKPIAAQLRLFRDENGLIRSKGRYQFANEDLPGKFPLLLPKNDEYTWLIIDDVHQKAHHAGGEHTLGIIRGRYWIPQGRSAVKARLLRCQVCRRWEGKPYKAAAEAPLPKDRIEESAPFEVTGVDFAGPLVASRQKVWVCLFTCAVTRAVHLELAHDMTTYDFMLCLRRFIAVNGTPKKIISDNAKTFKGAKLTLDRVWEDVILDGGLQSAVSRRGIKWCFNVERAPWWGGFFERMVGLVKRALKKSVGLSSLTIRELETLLAEIAATINTRPLSFVHTSDVGEGVPITPQDLCKGRKSDTVFPPGSEVADGDPEFIPKGLDKPSEVVKRLKYTQKLQEQFWSRWRTEYLLCLREHHRTTKSRKSSSLRPRIGDIVLLREQTPRATWKIGQIERFLPSHDNVVRAAEVKTGGKVLRRPIDLLIPLEISADDQDGKDTTVQALPDQSPSDATRKKIPTRCSTRRAARHAKVKIAAQLQSSTSDEE